MALPSRPRTVPPLVADPGGVRDCGTDLLAASSQVDDAGSFVAGAARVGDWHGDAAATYHAALPALGRQADAMSLALRGVAQRVDAHADDLTTLLAAREDLLDRRQHLDRWVSELVAEAARPMTPEERTAFDDRCRVAQSFVTLFDDDVAAWVRDVRAAETEMIEAFERVLSLAAVDRIYGGVADPADGALASKPPAGSPPAAVNDWWNSLTRAQQLAVIAASPGSIGNLDGIPAADRDAANSNALARDLADLGHTEDLGVLTDSERKQLENAQAAQDAREEIEGRTDPVTGEPIHSQIYIYDPLAFGGDGRIAISAGDLDSADNVAVTVPGFGTDATSATTHAGRAATLYESARYDDPTATNATMFWIGYDAPNGLGDGAGVVSEDMAEAGGDRLADTIDGLRATRDGDPAHLTVIGHSYGSTTVGHAGEGPGLDVDDIVVVGSPGLGGDTNHASDLGIDPEHVWAGANSHDVISNLGNHGSFHLETFGGGGLGDDPVEDDFGANRFQAESTTRGDGPDPTNDHNKYYEKNTESLYNMTQVVNGDYDDVTRADHLYDPWYSGPVDPEYDRDPTAPTTHPEDGC